jgi:putative MATE family efflux protein
MMVLLFSKSDPERDTAIMLGDPKVAIYSTVLPFLISILVGQINMVADVMWCSGLGSDDVSAIQIVSPIYWVVFDVGLGIGLGANVIISRRIGEGNRQGAQNIISQGMVLAVVIAAVLAPLMYFLIAPMMSWMGAPELTGMSESYMLPILACNIFQVLSPTLAGFLRGEGAAKKSNYSLMVGTTANIILDPILIFGLELGVQGAGIATAISFIINTVVMIALYRTGRTTLKMTFKGFRPILLDMKEIMYIGFPKMVEMFLMDILDAANRVFLIQCGGVDAVTLFSVPFRLLMLASMIPNSFALALTPVASANIGAKRPDKSVTAFYVSLKSILLLSGAFLVGYLLFADFLIIPFIQSESMAVLESGLVDVLRIDAFMIPAIGVSFVCNAMFQSMRRPMISLSLTILRTGLTTVAFALLCTTTVDYMCIGMVAVGIAAAILSYTIVWVVIRNLLKGYTPAPV